MSFRPAEAAGAHPGGDAPTSWDPRHPLSTLTALAGSRSRDPGGAAPHNPGASTRRGQAPAPRQRGRPSAAPSSPAILTRREDSNAGELDPVCGPLPDLLALPLTVFLLDRPWTQGPALPRLTRVRIWAEAVAHLPTVSGKVPI